MILQAAVATLLFALLSANKSRKKTSPSTTPPAGPGRPTTPKPTPQSPDPTGPTDPSIPKPKPTPTPKPVVPRVVPPLNSRVWGEPTGEYWMLGKESDGNFLMIAKDCSWVVEGGDFRDPESDTATEAPTLAATLALPHGGGAGHGRNSAWGYIDYLEDHGYDAVETAEEIVKSAAPMCASVGPQFWGDKMRAWYTNLVESIGVWRQGIRFDGPFGHDEVDPENCGILNLPSEANIMARAGFSTLKTYVESQFSVPYGAARAGRQICQFVWPSCSFSAMSNATIRYNRGGPVQWTWKQFLAIAGSRSIDQLANDPQWIAISNPWGNFVEGSDGSVDVLRLLFGGLS